MNTTKIKFLIMISIFLLNGCISMQKNEVSTTNRELNSKKIVKKIDINSGLFDLTNQIVQSLSETKKTKIAMVEFSNLDGNITHLGKYIAEELTTRLFRTGKFYVVERHLLNKVLDEHKLSVSGHIDESTAKSIGLILGVDSIATGTVTDLGDTIKINARLISTETGAIFAVASSEISKDSTINRLMSKISCISRATETQPTKTINKTVPVKKKLSKKEELRKKLIGKYKSVRPLIENGKYFEASRLVEGTVTYELVIPNSGDFFISKVTGSRNYDTVKVDSHYNYISDNKFQLKEMEKRRLGMHEKWYTGKTWDAELVGDIIKLSFVDNNDNDYQISLSKTR